MTLEYDVSGASSMLSVSLLPDAAHAAHAAATDDPRLHFGEGAWPPPLAQLLQNEDGTDSSLLGMVEKEIDRMQEDVLASLYAQLEKAGIRRDERLVISLAGDGQVDVGEHPQREAVLAVLAESPAIAERMRLMAALALTERGLSDIGLAGRMMRGLSHNTERIFQACLKGSLSHFHLVRRQ